MGETNGAVITIFILTPVLALFWLIVSILKVILGKMALDSANTMSLECSELRMWFMVFSISAFVSFGWAFLTGCLLSCKSKEEKEKPKGPFERFINLLTTLFNLFVFGWTCYGYNMYLNPPVSFQYCSEDQIQTFNYIAPLVFYIDIASICLICLLGCAFCCFILDFR